MVTVELLQSMAREEINYNAERQADLKRRWKAGEITLGVFKDRTEVYKERTKAIQTVFNRAYRRGDL